MALVALSLGTQRTDPTATMWRWPFGVAIWLLALFAGGLVVGRVLERRAFWQGYISALVALGTLALAMRFVLNIDIAPVATSIGVLAVAVLGGLGAIVRWKRK